MQKFNTREDALSYFSGLSYDSFLEARHANHLKVPSQMGIYCWFLREEGFELLSRKLPVQFRPPRQTVKVGDAYLIYYGYLGTDTALKYVKAVDNLQFYFQLNLPHKQLDYSLDSYSLLPCFRKTIGGLLCEDILGEQEAVKAFFNDYLLIHYIGYEATSEEEVAAASKATKEDFLTLKSGLDSLWQTFIAGTNLSLKNYFIYDDYEPELRIIIERCRFKTELSTLKNICERYQLDDEAGKDLITPMGMFFRGKRSVF